MCDHFKARFSRVRTQSDNLSEERECATTMAMLESIVGVLIIMLLVILIIILLACKPWRFFSSSSPSPPQVGDLERPLVSDDVNLPRDRSTETTRNYDIEGACFQNEGLLRSPRTQGLIHKQRISASPSHLTQGDSLALDESADPYEDVLVGQTLKRPLVTDHTIEVPKHDRKENQSPKLNFGLENNVFREFVPKVVTDQRSYLSLDVISGPSRGLRCCSQSTSASGQTLTLGRVSPSDLLLKDSEVSGKHAMINWNSNKMKWELVDIGSLNGTLLNSQPINHHSPESRRWGDPVELASGDIITLGTTSNIHVHITSQSECQIPFEVGIASDPMAVRRGGKKLPMEDVCYYQWPLPGVNQFGLFGICDGHGGAEAAKSASKTFPEVVARLLSDTLKRERVLSQCDASDVLRHAFCETEASMNHHHYEGCTATVLLVWTDGDDNFFVQCANVGDSACVMNVHGRQIKMTEDHRITSYSERLRISEIGEPLKDGETRLCGLNLGRMLGDKFLKQQDARFSSEPYISQAVHIDQASSACALLASDGFWDVMSMRKAIQLVVQTKERYSKDDEYSAKKIANILLSEARTLRTKDNTSIIFLDFDMTSGLSSCKVDC
ncbi:protein phosphatase 2C 70-like [Tripterygium wilfordii]|uniref:protein-serine/threonine phosphatase n=1 Tax=Tripterygium wilfordii TaxID=458696 RepID=A0A7J7E199_TRIWF|nr:protein phosphatase 2C 70-like [Tripterygium wilfordii]KAF5752301.1 protein phosphatase 2C 70-like [Tripterygium wilfordii]